MNETRKDAYQLINRVSEAQLSGLVRFLETIVDPWQWRCATPPGRRNGD